MKNETSEETTPGGVQAVIFALNILEFLAKHREPIGVTELANAYGTTKSRIFRHLRTLLLQGYIVQDDAGRYKIGTRLVALGNAVVQNFDLFQLSSGVMRALRDKVGSSVVLCQVDQGDLRVISVVPGKAQIEITVKPGSVLRFHSSAQGKIALAFGDPELMTRLSRESLPALSPQTIVSWDALEAEIRTVKEQGWAVAPGESVTGLNALAAPLLDASGSLIGTLALVDSVQFLPNRPPDELIADVVSAAGKISTNLGYRAL